MWEKSFIKKAKNILLELHKKSAFLITE